MAVNKFLGENKILTPKVFSHNYDKGIIVIEDFGDLSFHKILLKKKRKFETYKDLVNLILKIQKIKPKSKIKDIFNKSYKLDKYTTKYLQEESNLFFDWYLPLIISKKKTVLIKKKIKKFLIKLYKRLNFPDSYFVHRDFHVQNLIKVGKKIGVIDTQDALIGNPAYDLVSLIDDVRIKTSKNLKNQIYDYYVKKKFLKNEKNKKKFKEDFNILSIQRSLKIIGIFSRLFVRDKKNKYLKLLPYTWKLLEMRIKDGSFTEIREMLDKNISKKIRKKKFFK